MQSVQVANLKSKWYLEKISLNLLFYTYASSDVTDALPLQKASWNYIYM